MAEKLLPLLLLPLLTRKGLSSCFKSAPSGSVILWLPGMTLPWESTAKEEPTAVGIVFGEGDAPAVTPTPKSPGPATRMEAAAEFLLLLLLLLLLLPPKLAETGMLKMCGRVVGLGVVVVVGLVVSSWRGRAVPIISMAGGGCLLLPWLLMPLIVVHSTLSA